MKTAFIMVGALLLAPVAVLVFSKNENKWFLFSRRHKCHARHFLCHGMQRYWFEAAEPTLDAQFQMLRQVRRVAREHIEALTAGMDPITDQAIPKLWVQPSAFRGNRLGFQILSHVPNAKRSGRNYVARCPSCALRGEDRRGTHLSISAAEPRMYHCWAGCTKEEIRAALGQPIRMKKAA